MPAKKKAKSAAKKTVKKAAKTAVAKTKKTTVKKAAKAKSAESTKKKKAGSKKPAEKKQSRIASTVKNIIAKAPSRPKPEVRPEPKPAPPPPPPEPKKKLGIDCEHCDATGVCAAGTPYDKTHGQTFGARTRMTSCVPCLEAAGEHKNSKKLVPCRICDGDGQV